MATTYDPQAIVPMPRMKAATAATVGQSIESAHLGVKKHPANVEHAFQLHKVALEEFKRALISHMDPPTEALHLEESRVEAGNWSGLHSMLDGLQGSSLKKKAAIAAKLMAAIFPAGLTFLRLPTAERWTESDGRLTQIKELKLDADIHAIGAGDFLAAIQETHKALGDAAGITSAIAVTAKSGVQMAYDKWKAAMRCYIAQVVANQALSVAAAGSDAEVKAANDLAARLLAPIASVDSSNATKSDAPPASGTQPGAAAPAADSAAAAKSAPSA